MLFQVRAFIPHAYRSSPYCSYWVVTNTMEQALLQAEEQAKKASPGRYSIESVTLMAPNEGAELILVDHAAV